MINSQNALNSSAQVGTFHIEAMKAATAMEALNAQAAALRSCSLEPQFVYRYAAKYTNSPSAIECYGKTHPLRRLIAA